ncbi:MAG: GGDEF domain-containing protein, partial [Polyangiaceae bacterium]|nr:GGDEF domain-containing protein [Polyangiaceae bacterium]
MGDDFGKTLAPPPDEEDALSLEPTVSELARPQALKSRQVEAYLILLSGKSAGKRVVLEAKSFLLGRSVNADLTLKEDAVSRRHARVVFLHGEYMIEDLGSTNGTLVNEQRAKGLVTLADGDLIQIGHAHLKFLSQDNIESVYHEEFSRLARQDALTGLENRQTFDAEFGEAVEHASAINETIALILFDLDHFKVLNDTWGHVAGDLVLRSVGQKA